MARVKLGLRNLSIEETIMKGIGILFRMRSSPYFQNPVPSLDEIQTCLEELKAATGNVVRNPNVTNLYFRNSKKQEFLMLLRKLGGWISSQTTDTVAISSSGFDIVNGRRLSGELEKPRTIKTDFESRINILKIIWQPVPHAKQYVVEMSLDPYIENAQWSIAGYSTKSQFKANATLLKPLTLYFFRVRALGTKGMGPASSIVRGAIF